ncbi:MAG: undecaprenyl-diphosphate phosphatase [Clostridiales bacterium]|nr:undecaprenyl-diphosphate phosphatase [Clostridiales bacterium]
MEFLDVLKIILIGIIEGITEWLPVSSTGHMMIFANLWEKFGGSFWSSAFSKGFPDVFDYMIQLGAIIAVVVVFFNKIFPLQFNREKGGENVIEKRKIAIKPDVISMWLKVIIACIPAVLAIVADELFEGLNTTQETIVISVMLIVYGVVFIVIEQFNKNKSPKVNSVAELSYKTAFFIGCFQVLASIPGTSRSGITIIGALILGVSRVTAAEFTFFLAIPTMVGASGFKILKFFLDGGTFTSTEIWALLLGMVVAFAVSMVAIKALMSFVRKHDFKPFGWYRIALGVLLIIICLIIP